MINALAQILRKLYWLPGNYFIYLLFSKLFNSKIKTDSVIIHTPLNYKIRVNPQKYIGNTIFWRGAHEWHIIFILKKILKKNNIVLDVGANIGEVTLCCASLVPDGKVYAFEPVSSMYEELQNNILLNAHLKNIQIVKQGMSNAISEAPIYYDAKEHFNEGVFSIYPENFSNTKFVENIKINTIDNFVNEHKINSIHLIKIDVEGNELMVLQGAMHTLSKYRPHLIIELSQKNITAAKYKPDDIIALLSQSGYKKFFIIKTRGKLSEFKSANELPEFCNILVMNGK